MDRSLITENDIRDYLLGRVTDEERLEAFDEMLFSDEEFCSLAEAAEESLIDEHISGRLADRDREDLLNTLANNRELRDRVLMSSLLRAKALEKSVVADEVSIFDSIKAMFRQPAFVGGFAVLLIAIIAVSYFVLRPRDNELADLKAIYNKERPTESRISGFEYAPLVTTRGVAEEREAARLRRIELTLIEATERTPDARSFHSLGVFYLTQQKLSNAVEAFERSLKIDAKNAQTLNDLGSAYFEKAKAEPADMRFKTLSTALENFSKSVNLDAKFPAALFNRSLCMQELRLNNEARESWQQYLALDPSSAWANEARKNLEKLEQNSVGSKTKVDAVAEVVAASKTNDEAAAWNIASQTREMITGVWLPDQLIRKFLEAKIRGDDSAANDSIGALKFIGELERSRNADFFVAEIAAHYAQTDKTEQLLAAKDLVTAGFADINTRKPENARQSFTAGRDAFAAAGDRWNSLIADLWLAHALSDLSKIKDSDAILDRLADTAERNNYKWLSLVTSEWIAHNQGLRGEVGRSAVLTIKNLDLAEQLGDAAMRTKLSLTLADSYEGVGEIDRASGFLGRLNSIGPLYIQSGIRSWQRNFYSSTVSAKLGLLHAADQYAQEALVDIRSSPQKGSQAVDDTLRQLIDVNRQLGDFAAALDYAAQTQQLASETEDPVFGAKLMRYALYRVGNLRQEMGEDEAAISAFDEAIALRAGDTDVQIDAYEVEKGKLISLVALGRTAEAKTQLERTLELSESFRSKILDESSRLAFFNAEQSVYEAAVTNALASGDTRSAFDLAEVSRARNLLDFVQGDASVDAIQKSFDTVARPAKLSEIQGSIPPNVQIVEYLLMRDKIVIWYLTGQKFEMIETPAKASDIEALVSRFFDEAVAARSGADQTRSLSIDLHKKLIEPILPHLDSSKQLVLVPDKSLNKLPFAALLSGASGRYLIEDLTISYSPSTNVFVRMTQLASSRNGREDRIVAVGNPKFDPARDPGLLPLPSAGDEAKKIAEMYPSNKLIVDDRATKTEVMATLDSSQIFHFAGHYIANSQSLPNSRLVLADQGDEPDLRLSELAKLRLSNTKFVVLSACDTNAEQVFAGEGATGIAQTFLAIGSPLVVAGNWKVDSDSTRDLMVAFHRNRRTGGLNVAESLRQAQIEQMRSAEGNVRPAFYWAAFSAVGGSSAY